MTPLSTAELIDLDDLDGLLIRVDHLCADGDWDGLVDLRDRARRALERGRQLWPAASHAEYRMALEAPGRWAASVLVPGAARFALGPVSEVAASTHTWAELAPHAPQTPEASLAAHERVVRGEDLTADPAVDPLVLELPLTLQPWEPAYPRAEYKAHEASFGDPPGATPPGAPVTLDVIELPAPRRPAEEFEGCQALNDLAAAWRDESGGSVTAVAAAGEVPDALALLADGGGRPVRIAPIDPAEALATMGWAAASGGAHGRRRGMATGRFAAWWAVAALAGALDRWPVEPDEMGEELVTLRWFRWDRGHPATGWELRLAVELRRSGQEPRSWAVEAVDTVRPSAPAGSDNRHQNH